MLTAHSLPPNTYFLPPTFPVVRAAGFVRAVHTATLHIELATVVVHLELAGARVELADDGRLAFTAVDDNIHVVGPASAER